MRTLRVLLALVGFSGWLSDAEERVDSGQAGDSRHYGRLVLLREDSVFHDAFEASNVLFPDPLEEDSCGGADAKDEVVAIRIDVFRLLKEERGEMPRFRGPGASVSLQPSRGFGRIALSTSGPSSGGRLR